AVDQRVALRGVAQVDLVTAGTQRALEDLKPFRGRERPAAHRLQAGYAAVPALPAGAVPVEPGLAAGRRGDAHGEEDLACGVDLRHLGQDLAFDVHTLAGREAVAEVRAVGGGAGGDHRRAVAAAHDGRAGQAGKLEGA